MKATSNNDTSSQFLKTDRGKTKSNSVEIPSISLPKGGGAIRGIDEKFSVNAVNGTGAFSVSLPVSTSRGVSPALSLSYNSGTGNGIFGLGWSLSLGSIKRKTEKKLPQYQDGNDSDTFLFSETEDLVPEFKKEKQTNGTTKFVISNGHYIVHERSYPNSGQPTHTIRYYRPRIEGLIARIERWTEKANGRISWKVITKDNVTALFGWTDKAIIADPENPKKIFEWMTEFVFDDKGNCAHYVYKKEDGIGFDTSLAHNKNRIRGGQITYTNTYPEKILYGNKIPYTGFGSNFPSETDYLFSTVFDYGEYNANSPYDKTSTWDYRPDAFSEYKAGFEIRTTRLCKRVLLFHHFKGFNEYEGLVKSVNFEYNTSAEPDFTFLKTITSVGYIKKPDGTYTYQELSPLEFEYQKHEWNKDVKTISSDALVHAPAGIDEKKYMFTDLYNEGISGILTEQENGWYYKHNLGKGDFSQARLVSPKPSFTGLGSQLQLADLDSDGGKQIVSHELGLHGYFELNDDMEFQGFQSFRDIPNIDFSDPNTRMLDLNGDGMPDAIISEETVFTWYPSKGRDGFGEAKKTLKPLDEEEGPHIVFADATQSVYLADMSGDGLTDIVRIRNGEICYWPNKGYGKFGAKVTFDHSPVFDYPDNFHPSLIQLSDIDGSGTTDIIYLGRNRFTCWKNLSGNRFDTIPFEIDTFPDIHNQAKISVTDLLGNGVACIVWSSPLSKDAQSPLHYIDLMNSRKPHIMSFYKNNMGKEVSLEYKPSTYFYLEDKKMGKPWITRLHFPVHCIYRTTTEDKISGYKFVTEYKYHHGYYDHPEREFRGFGMVEQIDTETFEHWKRANATNVVEEPLHQEPVVTRNWYHTGAFLRKDKILSHFEKDYWYHEYEREFGVVSHPEVSLPDAIVTVPEGMDATLLDQLTADEWREALRACKGMALREETFAKDAAKFGNTQEAHKKELTPFSVATHNCVIELLQPKGKNKHAVFLVKESEAITYSYERNPDDPRIAHNLNIKIDEHGNVLESASVVYSRLSADASLPAETRQEQNKTIVIYTQNQFTNDVISDETYRLRIPSEVMTYELKGVGKASTYYSQDDFTNILSDAKSDKAYYHQIDKPLAGGKAQRRLIERVRSLYYKNNLSGPLPIGQIESLALPYESYQLAYTPELVTDIFGTKVNAALLTEGKFTHSEGDNNWWIRSGSIQFKTSVENQTDAQNRFYSPISYTDPFGGKTKVKYYGSYFLFIKETEDALGNKSSVDLFNFRTLSPKRMMDINENLSEVFLDELGLVKALVVMGKVNEADEGTGLSDATEASELSDINQFFLSSNSVQLTTHAKNLLKRATTRFVYDLQAYTKSGKPAVVTAISREKHYRQLADSPVQIAFEYSNGLGEVIMKKVQAEPGIAKQIIVHSDNTYTKTIPDPDTSKLSPKQLRWIGNGRTIKNNKGNPVKQYEPYFSVNWHYEDHKELVESGVTPKMYYDAAGRMIKTELPDGTFSKVEFNSWKQAIYDPNDTILESSWYHNRTNRLIDAQLIAEEKDPAREKQAADKTAKHANTPNVLHFDTLGRPVLSVEHNKNISTEADEFYHTKIKLDTEGNLRTVTDARGNNVMQYKYDMLGNMVYQNSMDAGQRWLLTNILSKPLRTWDERSHEFQYFYDIAQRPIYGKVIGGDGAAPLDNIFDKIIYGESLLTGSRTDANRLNEAALQARNILGQVIKHFDTGGLVDTPNYDFKGQPLAITRKLFKKYKEVTNWIDANLSSELESTEFTFSNERDALGRIIRQTTPDKSVITPIYNEAGLLNAENVNYFNPSTNNYEGDKVYIKDIDYNEKGQREKIVYGNDVFTRFYYDRETFRLKRLVSKRLNNDPLQDWYYTYDPAGNITHVADQNIPVIFFDNQKVTGDCNYTYDALYRLAEATGRENDASLTIDSKDNWNDNAFMHQLSPGDPMAVRNYIQKYKYDEVGNILQMHHQASGNNWTRNYTYQAGNNRLISTQTGSQIYHYPHHALHGYITEMPHLEEMEWNFKEELVRTIRQKRTDGGTPETTYYQYDGSGQRMRKITENQAASGAIPGIKEERIYVSGYEIYKKHSGTNAGLERVCLSLMDQDHRFAMIETRYNVDDGTEKQLTRYQLHNYLGSSSLEVDETAKVISYEEYHPYGTTAYQAKNKNIKSAAKRYRYTGMERDEETGLEYHSARYYLPWLGRWLSCDPSFDRIGSSIFIGMNNNPVNIIDPDGREGGWWDTTISGIHDANQWIKETAWKAGEKIQDNAEETIQRAGIKNQFLTGAIRGVAVLQATLASTVLEVGAGILMTGPNILAGLEAGGTEIGEGLGRVVYGETTEEKIVGGLQVLSGVGKGAEVTLQVITMKRSWGSGTIKKKGQSPTVQENKAHGDKFRDKVVDARSTPWRESTNEVTIRPNVGPNKPGKTSDNFRIDTLERSKITGGYELVESKGTATASLTKNQTPGFENFQKYGGEVRGAGGGSIAPEGTQLPPSKIKLYRPVKLFVETSTPPAVIRTVQERVRNDKKQPR